MKVVVVMKVSVLRYFKLQLACGINLSRKREKEEKKSVQFSAAPYSYNQIPEGKRRSTAKVKGCKI